MATKAELIKLIDHTPVPLHMNDHERWDEFIEADRNAERTKENAIRRDRSYQAAAKITEKIKAQIRSDIETNKAERRKLRNRLHTEGATKAATAAVVEYLKRHDAI